MLDVSFIVLCIARKRRYDLDFKFEYNLLLFKKHSMQYAYLKKKTLFNNILKSHFFFFYSLIANCLIF